MSLRILAVRTVSLTLAVRTAPRSLAARAVPLTLLLLSGASFAQAQPRAQPRGSSSAAASAAPSAAPPAPPPAPAPAPPEDEKAQAKQLARVHFDKGVTLQEEEAWAPALAELRRSIALFPTRAATKNAAICLQKLERYDEALETFQTLLRDYPSLTAEDKALAQRSITRLKGLVGALEIAGVEVAAASILVDGKGRGETPIKAPLKVSAGSHVVRVYKDGYLPFETRVDVAGGQSTRVDVKLAALTQSGRLKVSDAKGRALDVLVDNVVVGKTPWEGALAPGTHSVWLREGEEFGTQPATARVKLDEVTVLNLVAEELEAWIRIEPTPAGAGVSIDGVEVGRGVWEGRVRSGDHRIEVADDGFLASSRSLALGKGGREIVLVDLARDRSAARWARPAHPFVDFSAGYAFSPEFGGGLSERCTATCQSNFAPGGLGLLHVGYALSSGLELGGSVGFVSLGASRTEDSVVLLDPVGGIPPQRGTTRDALRINAAALGLHFGFHLGERFPFTARLAAGVLLGSFVDDRTASFIDSAGQQNPTGVVRESPSFAAVYVGPEARIGYRLRDNVELSAGVIGLALIGISQPTWNNKRLVNAGADGVGTYPNETLLGDVTFAVAPSLGLRFDF